MSNSKHTPGPWIYRSDVLQVIDSDVPGPGAPEGICICDMNPCDFLPDARVWRYRGVTEANARLIAASPKLLAALRKLTEQIDAGTSADYRALQEAGVMRVSSAAIAEAEGR